MQWDLTNDRLAIVLGIEYCWNVFPATPISSSILLAAHSLLLSGVWFGYAEGRS
jgi:alpha-1,3-mannosyltransferase